MSEWTKEPPTELGWYWWRIGDRVEICRVVDGGYVDQPVAFQFTGDQTGYMSEAIVGEWLPERIEVPV